MDNHDFFDSELENLKLIKDPNFSKNCVCDYVKNVENESIFSCEEFIKLLGTYFPKSHNLELQVLKLQTKGDIFRYIYQIASDKNRGILYEHMEKTYREAYEIAVNKLYPTHIGRIRFVLKYFEFLLDIKKEPMEAFRMGQHNLGEAEALLPNLDKDKNVDVYAYVKKLSDRIAEWSRGDEFDVPAKYNKLSFGIS